PPSTHRAHQSTTPANVADTIPLATPLPRLLRSDSSPVDPIVHPNPRKSASVHHGRSRSPRVSAAPARESAHAHIAAHKPRVAHAPPPALLQLPHPSTIRHLQPPHTPATAATPEQTGPTAVRSSPPRTGRRSSCTTPAATHPETAPTRSDTCPGCLPQSHRPAPVRPTPPLPCSK